MLTQLPFSRSYGYRPQEEIRPHVDRFPSPFAVMPGGYAQAFMGAKTPIQQINPEMLRFGQQGNIPERPNVAQQMSEVQGFDVQVPQMQQGPQTQFNVPTGDRDRGQLVQQQPPPAQQPPADTTGTTGDGQAGNGGSGGNGGYGPRIKRIGGGATTGGGAGGTGEHPRIVFINRSMSDDERWNAAKRAQREGKYVVYEEEWYKKAKEGQQSGGASGSPGVF